MNLFIFGAGASYGADTEKSCVPPLAADLFNHLARQYSDISGNFVAMSLASEFSKDFEQGLLKLYERQPQFWSVLQRCMAHFFFQYGINIPIKYSNLYYRLAQEIKKSSKSVAVATLNYERLLEITFLQAGIPLVCGNSAVTPQVELCLPHGCCHLFCEGAKGMSGGVFFDPQAVTTNGPVIAINEPKDFEKRIREEAFPPVMSYFEPKKGTTSGNNFIIEQRARFASLVSTATKITIIGIRVREHDDHVWNPLKETNAKIVYCSGKDAAAEYEQWRAGVPARKNDRIISDYWEQAFDAINSEML